VDGRWQRGEIVPALYLADRGVASLAGRVGFSPQDHVPYDHHRWRLELEFADLSDIDRLHGVALDPPRPRRRTSPAYQQVGEQLWRESWDDLIAPSAAHSGSLVRIAGHMCVHG
jgi:hypothetical protein